MSAGRGPRKAAEMRAARGRLADDKVETTGLSLLLTVHGP